MRRDWICVVVLASLVPAGRLAAEDVRRIVAAPVKAIRLDGKLDEDAWRAAPDGRLEFGFYGGGIWLWDFEKWEGRLLVPGPQDGHISWQYVNDWFFAGTTGAPLSGPFSIVLMKVYADGTWYVVSYGNTRNTEYNTNFFANISPDGTKGSFSSTMLGSCNMFWCVISYPEPPVSLVARTEAGKVALSWTRPKRSAEIAGYRVYRSGRSGAGYERVTPGIVAGEAFSDVLPDPDRLYHYVVTSVEHSGLESRCFSNEVVGGKADPSAPERLFVEAERGDLKAPLRENFHGSASNLLFVDYRNGNGEGSASWLFPTGKAGEYRLWVRCRYQGGGAPLNGWRVSDGRGPVGIILTRSTEWEWVRLEKPVAAVAGGTRIALVAANTGLALDKLFLTDDAQFRPDGEEKLDAKPPAVPAGLKLDAARHFDVSFSWTPVADDVSRYQVYRGSAPDFRPGPESLIGSPAVPRFLDWGLAQKNCYYYRVSAVDAFGNESASSPALAVETPALERIVDLTLEAESGRSSEPLDVISEPAASGGKIVKMAKRGADGKRFPVLELDFDVPVSGDYVVWLKLCRVSRDLEYAYLSAQVDGGPKQVLLCRFPSSGPSLSYRDTCMWRYVSGFRQSLPARFQLAAGRHRLTVSEAHMQDFGLDLVFITNDLGKVRAQSVLASGRRFTWE